MSHDSDDNFNDDQELKKEENARRRVLAILGLVAVIPFGCFLGYFAVHKEREQKNSPVHSDIEWKVNEHGIPYFLTCIEGKEFVITKYKKNGFPKLSGPTGECAQENTVEKN